MVIAKSIVLIMMTRMRVSEKVEDDTTLIVK